MKKESKQQIQPFAYQPENQHFYSVNQPNKLRTVFTQEMQIQPVRPHHNRSLVRAHTKDHIKKKKDYLCIDSQNIKQKKRNNLSLKCKDKMAMHRWEEKQQKFIYHQDTQYKYEKTPQNGKKEIQILKEHLKELMESQFHSKKNSQVCINVERNNNAQNISVETLNKPKVSPTATQPKHLSPIHFAQLKLQRMPQRIKIKKKSIQDYNKRSFRFSQKYRIFQQNPKKQAQTHRLSQQQVKISLVNKLNRLKNWRLPKKYEKQPSFKPITNQTNNLPIPISLRSGLQQKGSKENIDGQIYQNIHGIKQKTLKKMFRVLKFE